MNEQENVNLIPEKIPETQPEAASPPAQPEAPADSPNAAEEAASLGAEALYRRWMEEADAAREIYPQLDLEAELRNPKFVGLLRGKVDIRTAYEAVHMEEILPAAMQYAARRVEEKLANSLRAAPRPAENGMTGQGAVVTGRDPAKISRQDYADICRRVAQGERVSFG